MCYGDSRELKTGTLLPEASADISTTRTNAKQSPISLMLTNLIAPQTYLVHYSRYWLSVPCQMSKPSASDSDHGNEEDSESCPSLRTPFTDANTLTAAGNEAGNTSQQHPEIVHDVAGSMNALTTSSALNVYDDSPSDEEDNPREWRPFRSTDMDYDNYRDCDEASSSLTELEQRHADGPRPTADIEATFANSSNKKRRCRVEYIGDNKRPPSLEDVQ